VATVAIGPFVRFLIAAGAAAFSNWDSIQGLFQRVQEYPETPVFGMHLHNVFEMKDNAGAFALRERGLFGIHLINVTGGDLDVTWTTTDFSDTESRIKAQWNAMGGLIGSDCRLVEHRWYRFGPGIQPPNPPIRTTNVTTATGTGSPVAPHQTATTVTLRTPLRRHWGRFYLPVHSPGTLTGGQLSTANVDSIASLWRDMFVGAAGLTGVTPVVYDRARRAMMGVTEIEVDSNLDIQRRRRPRTTNYKRIYTA
jgi:hypothetical protein